MANFRPIDRDTGFLMPPSVNEWLPERHLARFIVEVVEALDLRSIIGSYQGKGSSPYHPSMLLAMLLYGYATGVFSSRKLERATYDSVAFRFIAANQHPDHDTIANFRRRFLKEIEGLFVEVLKIAREMGMLNLGTVGLDGTKVHANASRHSALSHGHLTKIEEQLKAEVAELLKKAEAADQAEVPDGMSIPDELKRREDRLAKLAEAKAKIEARAKERFEQEQAEYEAKMKARAAKEADTGRKSGGRPPQPPTEGPRPDDQINLTDEESRIMPVAGGGYEQCYNAQAMVAAGSMLVVATDVVQACNDKQQVVPMVEKLEALPEELGKPGVLLADTDDCQWAPSTPPTVGRAVRAGARGAEGPDTGRGHGASAEDAQGKGALCAAQTDPGARVRHRQGGARLPTIPAARPGVRPRRMELGEHSMEPEADVRPQPRLRRSQGRVSGLRPGGVQADRLLDVFRTSGGRFDPPGTNCTLHAGVCGVRMSWIKLVPGRLEQLPTL